jgi:molybdate transport system regulatory protein
MPLIGALKLKAQIVCGDAFAMGPGKADVLDAIAREGSISAAGRALGMSYRKTWLLVDTMNRCWTAPLVETTAGGGQSSGARLTQLGREVLAAYRDLEACLAEASDSAPLRALSAKLLSKPRASRDAEAQV